MTEIPHVAAIELEAAILGAEIIAILMQPDADGYGFDRFIDLLCNYFHGRGGDTPAKGDLAEAASIRNACDEWYARRAAGREIRKNSLLVAMLAVYNEARALDLTGDPDADWRAMRRILENGVCPRLKGLAEEVRNVRLLDRGTQLRQELSEDWRDNGTYANALAITQRAFVQEHFSTNAKPETGVVVMNMHKAKGKQFDEVIIFEGWPRFANRKIVANFDRIVRGNAREEIDDQARQNFRVSVTRGRQRTTILTPRNDPCVLLLPTTT
jgi:DNA helicase-2/ATP-dependent DNA helicase PcrA